MSKTKIAVLGCFFGFVAIVVSVAATIVGVILSFLSVPAMIFTGLWLIYFGNKDYPDDSDDD